MKRDANPDNDCLIMEGAAAKEYTTNDIYMIQALLALRYQPVRIFGQNGLLHYVFDREQIGDDLKKLESNTDISVSIRDVWAASRVWSMVYHEYRARA